MKTSENLRGRTVIVTFDGSPRRVEVVTRIRGDVWMIDGRELPKRFERYRGCRRTTVRREAMTLVDTPDPESRIRQATSPIERMIDLACGR